MGLFSGIDKAEIAEKGKYLSTGFVGKLRVRRTLAKDSIKSGLAFIVEFDVVESNLEEHPVGSSATWYQKMTDKTVALPAIKSFVLAASGVDPANRDAMAEINSEIEGILDEATTNETNNALVGQEVFVTTFSTKTKKGFDFTNHRWTPSV